MAFRVFSLSSPSIAFVFYQSQC